MPRTYFISDIHLGALYIKNRRSHERRIVAWLDTIADDADELYLVGDILDYWYEYRTVVPRGYVRFFGALARLADKGVRITWLIGNHDIWLFDYLRHEIGINIIDGAIRADIGGHSFFISHGDALGRLKPGFRFIRALFRNKICQTLFASIHPRWTVPFAYRWSCHNRLHAAGDFEAYASACLATVKDWATPFLADNPDIDYIVLGHHHFECNEELHPRRRLVILGNCIDEITYGVFDGSSFQLKHFDSANT